MKECGSSASIIPHSFYQDLEGHVLGKGSRGTGDLRNCNDSVPHQQDLWEVWLLVLFVFNFRSIFNVVVRKEKIIKLG